MRPPHGLVPALLLLLGSSVLAAQTGGLELTAYAGPNYSWLSGTAESRSEGRVGVSIGLHLHQPIGGDFSIDPDLGFAYKGANAKATAASPTEAVVSARLWYLQMPVPIRYTMASKGRVKPRLSLGPYVAIRAGCTAELEGQGLVATQSCSDLHSLSDTAQLFDPYKTWDTGFVAGLGFSVPLFRTRVDFDLRYEHGLLNISRTAAVNRNRTVMLAVGVPF